MKKGTIKMLALFLLGAATLTSCAVENRGHRGWHGRRHDHHYYRY